jgi:hypothetical protein
MPPSPWWLRAGTQVQLPVSRAQSDSGKADAAVAGTGRLLIGGAALLAIIVLGQFGRFFAHPDLLTGPARVGAGVAAAVFSAVS